jgi:hypothetical protein
MGSSSQETTSQQQTSPWAAAMPTVNSLFNGVNSLIPTSGLNSTEQSAISQLEQNGANGNPFQSGMNNTANTLLNGGNATAEVPFLNTAYENYAKETNPLASNTNYDPMQTPGIGTTLQALNNNITNQINGQFSAGGRTGSAANTLALATGLAQGEAPVLTNQYNQNVQNQMNAANSLFGAGNTTGSTIANMNQNANTNMENGITAANSALTGLNWGPQTALAAAVDADRRAIGQPGDQQQRYVGHHEHTLAAAGHYRYW